MIPYRKLSIALTDLLAEAQALVDLKAKFGRLPNSALKDAALEEIEEWFKAKGEDDMENINKPKLIPSNISTSAGLTSAGSGFSQFSDSFAMADEVPDDDGIPF